MTDYEKRELEDLRRSRDRYRKAQSLLRDLMTGIRATLVWGWYLLGLGGAVLLYFEPMVESQVQGFVALGAFLAFTLISKATYKTKEVEARMDD